jgi:hypothetical protein
MPFSYYSKLKPKESERAARAVCSPWAVVLIRFRKGSVIESLALGQQIGAGAKVDLFYAIPPANGNRFQTEKTKATNPKIGGFSVVVIV